MMLRHWAGFASTSVLLYRLFLSFFFAFFQFDLLEFLRSLSVCLCPSCLFFDRLYSHWLLASSCHSCTDNNTHAWPKPYTKTDSSIYNKQTFDFRSRVWQRERERQRHKRTQRDKKTFVWDREREGEKNQSNADWQQLDLSLSLYPATSTNKHDKRSLFVGKSVREQV